VRKDELSTKSWEANVRWLRSRLSAHRLEAAASATWERAYQCDDSLRGIQLCIHYSLRHLYSIVCIPQKPVPVCLSCHCYRSLSCSLNRHRFSCTHICQSTREEAPNIAANRSRAVSPCSALVSPHNSTQKKKALLALVVFLWVRGQRYDVKAWAPSKETISWSRGDKITRSASIPQQPDQPGLGRHISRPWPGQFGHITTSSFTQSPSDTLNIRKIWAQVQPSSPRGERVLGKLYDKIIVSTLSNLARQTLTPTRSVYAPSPVRRVVSSPSQRELILITAR